MTCGIGISDSPSRVSVETLPEAFVTLAPKDEMLNWVISGMKIP
jgi:hypothetical protein